MNTLRITDTVFIRYELREGKHGLVFSAQGEIYSKTGRGDRDCMSCGQNLEEIARMFPNHTKLQEFVQIWRDWHLNDMNAGTPEQMAFLKTYLIADKGRWYESACQGLKDNNLYEVPVTDEMRKQGIKGETYRFGYAWLYHPLPQEIVEKIKSFTETALSATESK